ncbi:MAG: MFS transporter [Deltaproteobacteria bacterium]|nr:MFS transporter [Deltaproteobacteria bacterium]
MGRSRTVVLFNGFCFASRCYFYLPVFVLWFLAHGLTQLQVMLLLSIYFVTATCAEIPSGLFADRYGRKWALVVGSLAQAAGAACLAGAGAWALLVAGELCLGLGQAFQTGIKEAFLYDHCKAHGHAEEYQSRYGESKFFEFAAMSVGAVCGVPLYGAGGPWPFVATAAIFLAGGGLAALLREPLRGECLGRPHPLREGWREVRHGDPALRRRIGYYAWFLSLVLIVTMSLGQPYLRWTGFPLILFGWGYLFFHLFAMAGTIWARRVTPAMADRFFLALGGGLAGVLLVLAFWRHPTAFWILGLVYFGWGLLLPTISAAINPLVDSPRRATILSIQDFAQSAVFVVIAALAGYAADRWGIPSALIGLGMASGMVLLATTRRRKE